MADKRDELRLDDTLLTDVPPEGEDYSLEEILAEFGARQEPKLLTEEQKPEPKPEPKPESKPEPKHYPADHFHHLHSRCADYDAEYQMEADIGCFVHFAAVLTAGHRGHEKIPGVLQRPAKIPRDGKRTCGRNVRWSPGCQSF